MAGITSARTGGLAEGMVEGWEGRTGEVEPFGTAGDGSWFGRSLAPGGGKGTRRTEVLVLD